MEKTQFEKYLEVSGAIGSEAERAKARFGELLGKFGNLPSDLGTAEAAEQVRDMLHEDCGFDYRGDTFRAQDILARKRANCSGFPMLTACILNAKGYTPENGHKINFRAIIHPTTDISGLEEEEVFETMGSDQTLDRRTVGEDEFRGLHFSSSEHCVLDAAGKIVETTCPNFQGRCGGEVIYEPHGFDRQLGILLRDRASLELDEGNADKAKELLGRAIIASGDYRESFPLAEQLAVATFDDKARDFALRRYQEIGGNDSRFHFNMFNATKKREHLVKALEEYPQFALALAAEAIDLEKRDPKEARSLFSIASKCFARSSSLELPDFYTSCAGPLARLFGREQIIDTMNGFADECDGKFNYYQAMYSLTKDEKFLRAMRDSAKTPWQELVFSESSRGTKYFDAGKAKELESRHGHSEIYRAVRQGLNSSEASD